MSVPFPGHSSDESAGHFDLGVDTLASANDIEHIEDPWTPTEDELPEPRFPHPLTEPTPGMGPWADDLQLPGI